MIAQLRWVDGKSDPLTVLKRDRGSSNKTGGNLQIGVHQAKLTASLSEGKPGDGGVNKNTGTFNTARNRRRLYVTVNIIVTRNG